MEDLLGTYSPWAIYFPSFHCVARRSSVEKVDLKALFPADLIRCHELRRGHKP